MATLRVLGIAQDGGHPQAGCPRPCCAGLAPGAGHLPACLAIVDETTGQRWLVDATPALPEQLRRLNAVAPGPLSGILLTHAHMGHYLGLAYLGREGMAVHGLPLGVQPRMAIYLAQNGPWNQLIAFGHVRLWASHRFPLAPGLTVEALPVPHRDEVSETVAFVVRGPRRAALWLPDLDAWEAWDRALPEVLAGVDIAWIDGTFWADGELDRDMREVPHPRIVDTLARLAALPAAERAKVHFIHLNHTNPALRAGSPERAHIEAAGMAVGWEGQAFEV
jgi:pyrroloquinoline quinone biosynthesis protein B